MNFPAKKIFQYLFVMICWKGHDADVLIKTLNNYGPYNVEFTGFAICAGPKQKNLTHFTMELIKEGEDNIANVNLTFLTQSRIDEIKITVFTVKDNKKTLLINYKVKDPCQHYALANMIETYMKANNCLVKKGNYFTSVNLSAVTRQFFGASFFYGAFLFKAVSTSKQGNILCLTLDTIYSKKKL